MLLADYLILFNFVKHRFLGEIFTNFFSIRLTSENLSFTLQHPHHIVLLDTTVVSEVFSPDTLILIVKMIRRRLRKKCISLSPSVKKTTITYWFRVRRGVRGT